MGTCAATVVGAGIFAIVLSAYAADKLATSGINDIHDALLTNVQGEIRNTGEGTGEPQQDCTIF